MPITLDGTTGIILSGAAGLSQTGDGELTLGNTLDVASGGTGANNLNGIVKGDGTNALTAGKVSLSTEISGTLNVASGGTGGLLPVANGGTGLTDVGTTGNVLTSNGTSWISQAPTATINLRSQVTNTLQVANGGTGLTDVGTTGNVLTSNGTSWISQGISIPSSNDKIWTAFTANGTYTVPTGKTSIRVYAFGKGGDGGTSYSTPVFNPYGGSGGGGGGGCAFGDIAVTPGSNVSIIILSDGTAKVVYNSTTLLTANPGSAGNVPSGASPNFPTGGTGGAGGTASIDASVTNGGAYTGGSGGSGGTASGSQPSGSGGGGSAASPLGNGYAGGNGGSATSSTGFGGGGGGIGGAGGNGGVGTGFLGGGGGGAGGAGANGTVAQAAGGGAGGAASGTTPGKSRSFVSAFSDPLLRFAIFAGGSANNISMPGSGGACISTATDKLTGGDFGGGAGGSGNGTVGSGGFLGGSGGNWHITHTSYGGGGGGTQPGLSTTATGGAAIILIYG